MGSCNGMAFFTSNFMSVHETPHEDQDHHHHHPPTSQLINTLLPASCSPQDFHGVASLLGKRSMSFSGFDQVCHDQEANNGDDDYSDDGSQVGEKKRRLNMEQVKTLEKNFELGNKLEPERKMQLARALGLQPRQIAIWFQNRRARWKTKQLEKDYDLLKRQFEAIKADNDALQAQNKKLHAEILALKSREVPTEFIINLNNKETEGSSSNRSENSSELNLDISTTQPAIDSPPLSSSQNHHQHHHHPSLFSSSIIRPTTTTTTTNHHHLAQQQQQQQQQQQYPKIEPTTNVQEDQSFTNIFCGIDDQPNFWPWQEQQQFH